MNDFELTKDKNLLKELELLRDKAKGFTYIMSNPSRSGWFKVGNTKDPKTRLSVANRWCPQKAYKMEFTTYTKDKKRVEKQMHLTLRHHGVSRQAEWFEFNLNKLIDLAKYFAQKEASWHEMDDYSFVIPQEKKYSHVFYKSDLSKVAERMNKRLEKLGLQ